MERLQRGDSQALLALYDRYAEYVYSIALLILNHSAAAEEVTQEVFLLISVRSLQTNFLAGTMHGWLAVTSRNKAISVLRRQSEDSLEDAVEPSPHDFSKVSGQKMACPAFVTKLDNDQQFLLQLAFLEGRTHVEIAAATGYPLGSIKTEIGSALAAMRKDAAC